MVDPAPATTGFLGVFFTVILVICLAAAGFAGFVVWRSQSVETGVSADQQGAGAQRPAEDAPPRQQ